MAGGIPKKIWGVSMADKGVATIQRRRNGLVMMVKRDRVQHSSPKQHEQRRRYCHCDEAYRQLTPYMRDLLRGYTARYNHGHSSGYNIHQLWMKLCLSRQLNDFLENDVGLEFTDVQVTQTDTGWRYQFSVTSESEQAVHNFFARPVHRVLRKP